jgi:hypothetical protein
LPRIREVKKVEFAIEKLDNYKEVYKGNEYAVTGLADKK